MLAKSCFIIFKVAYRRKEATESEERLKKERSDREVGTIVTAAAGGVATVLSFGILAPVAGDQKTHFPMLAVHKSFNVKSEYFFYKLSGHLVSASYIF